MNAKTPKIKSKHKKKNNNNNQKLYHNKERKEVRKRKRSVPQKKANVGSTTTLCTSLKKSCRGKLEKKTLRAMIGSLEKSEREK